MKIKIHNNGWTVIAEDINLAEITQQEVNLLGRYLLTNTMVVFKNQKLTVDDEVRITRMFGDSKNHKNSDIQKNFILPNSDDVILRVTGELDKDGKPGMFGHAEELIWHCNRVTDPNRKILKWLYGISGTEGSRTSFINNILSYNDLSQDEKDLFAQLHLDVGRNSFQEYYSGKSDHNVDLGVHYPKLVYTNVLGVTGLFFPFNQIHFIKEWEHEKGRELINDLRARIEHNENYIYHHDWEDGDVVMQDQCLGLHKRWAFNKMSTRVLHRIATDYTNINLNNLPPN